MRPASLYWCGFTHLPDENQEVHDWTRKVHDELVKVPVEISKVLDWNEKVPVKSFRSASLENRVLSFNGIKCFLLLFHKTTLYGEMADRLRDSALFYGVKCRNIVFMK